MHSARLFSRLPAGKPTSAGHAYFAPRRMQYSSAREQGCAGIDADLRVLTGRADSLLISRSTRPRFRAGPFLELGRPSAWRPDGEREIPPWGFVPEVSIGAPERPRFGGAFRFGTRPAIGAYSRIAMGELLSLDAVLEVFARACRRIRACTSRRAARQRALRPTPSARWPGPRRASPRAGRCG
jgi:hypothetical protein